MKTITRVGSYLEFSELRHYAQTQLLQPLFFQLVVQNEYIQSDEISVVSISSRRSFDSLMIQHYEKHSGRTTGVRHLLLQASFSVAEHYVQDIAEKPP